MERNNISGRKIAAHVLRTPARQASHGAAALALLAACGAGRGEESPPDRDASAPGPLVAAIKPDGFLVQFGIANEVTTGTAGLVWSIAKDRLPLPWSVYLEASLSRWDTRSGYASDHGVLTQIALIPVLRYRFDQGRSPWFAEGGIGATVTSSLYRNSDKNFSTSFNFGDHLGVGYSFGAQRKDEIALRAEHFSNAGIKHPNPGQNFLELRYTHMF